MELPAVELTSIGLILANTDALRLHLEKRLRVTQDEMGKFFFNVFRENDMIAPSTPSDTAEQRLEVVRQVIQTMRSTGR